MDFSTMSNDDLTAALTTARTRAAELFALETPTVEQVDEAETVVASIGSIEAEQASRAAVVEDAAKRFAAARAQFSTEDEATDDTETDDAETDEDGTEEVEAATETADDTVDETGETTDDTEEPETVTASVDHTKTQRITAARKVARKVKRPTVEASQSVVITAAADIPNVPMGSTLDGMAAVAQAVTARVGGFAPFNQRAAEAAHRNSGGAPVLNKFAVASFKVAFDEDHVGGQGDKDYNAAKASVDAHKERITASLSSALSGQPDTLTAAGWCAPSEVVYNWIADYVVDGLISIPEVSAPRGGLMLTEGPQLLQTTFADPSQFGWGGTEAQAIAGTFNKTCEVIECPDFVDHRLDFDGYCWKIPILTESAFPELVADAMRLSDVAYAHRMNRRYIADITAASTLVDATPYGGSFTDTIEALTQIAVKERRWWNVGENAVMEVKLPQFVRDVFKFDMARRSGLALNDVATDQKIAAHFANHNLSVEYVSDMQDLSGAAPATADWPGKFSALIYPVGTFLRAAKDVINLSAVYDAASLAENEYTGVFFEQGVKIIKRGYRSHRVEIPVCTAGVTGANSLECIGGSF